MTEAEEEVYRNLRSAMDEYRQRISDTLISLPFDVSVDNKTLLRVYRTCLRENRPGTIQDLGLSPEDLRIPDGTVI